MCTHQTQAFAEGEEIENSGMLDCGIKNRSLGMKLSINSNHDDNRNRLSSGALIPKRLKQITVVVRGEP